MFLTNPERRIDLSSSDYRTPTSIISSLGFDPNYNPLLGPQANPVNGNGVDNLMDNYNAFWSHTVPADMPWAQQQIQANPTNLSPLSTQPYIMRFTAGPSIYNQVCSPDPCTSQTATEWELLNKLSSGTGTCTSNLHLKRRNSSDDDDSDTLGQPPTKQYISEDKVTAKFNEMSLSNSEPALIEDIPVGELNDNELETDNDNSEPTIILSNEIKQALNARNDRIERIFQDELNKSSKSLVLWHPPIGLLPPPLHVYKTEKEEENEKSKMSSLKSYELLDVDVNDSFPMDANEMMDL